MFTKKKRFIASVVAIIMALFCGVYFIVSNEYQRKASIRTMQISEQKIDYSSIFNEFEDAKLMVDEQTNSVEFSGMQTIDKAMFDEIDNISFNADEQGVEIEYEFDYSADTNEFYLSIIANKEDGVIVDKWFGVPFVTENNEIDISFATDDGIILLSELDENETLENCGWFSRLKKAAKAIVKNAPVIAVVATVVAVVIVAAPAVAAAATTVSTAVAVGGGAALTGTTAAAAIAAAAAAGTAAMATTAFAVAGTTAIVASATAIMGAVVNKISQKTYSSRTEKINAARQELQKRRPGDTIIYRKGSDSYYNLTPRETDTNGLSFFAGVYYESCVITTKELINSTGILYAKGSNHVLVSPVAGDIRQWIQTKNNANSNPHLYSVTLKKLVIKL